MLIMFYIVIIKLLKKENSNLSKHFGSVKFHRDAMEIQKEMRDEWN